MANRITRSIPNTLTCLNLFSGCIACVMAFEANYNLALVFIILSAVFDFFDGMMARLLNAHSPIGKDLDSLADDVSFGVAPSLVVFSLFKEMYYPPDQFLYRCAGSCQRPFLGIVSGGHTSYPYLRELQSFLSVNIGLPVLMAAGIGNTDVLIEVQESFMERQ